MKDTIQLVYEIRWSSPQDAGERGVFVRAATAEEAREQYAKVAGKPGVTGVHVRMIEENSGVHVRDVNTSKW